MKALTLFLTFVVFDLGTKSNTNIALTEAPADKYVLVWTDEFDTEGAPDPRHWNFEKGFVRNEELQWYQPANAKCEKGLLIIEARREQMPNPNYIAGSANWKENRKRIQYTSSSINTKGLQRWTYGRFVMKARIDISPGLWPAFWTLGETGEWPSNGEIDIMEYYGGKILANIACGTSARYKPQWFSKTYNVDSLGGKVWAEKFHEWRMDWDDDTISLYLDDQLLNRVEVDKLFNKDNTQVNPFRKPHYILLNLALGGANGGDPSATKFPNKYEIDYVRVYQKKK